MLSVAPAEVVKEVGAWRSRGELETTQASERRKRTVASKTGSGKNFESAFHSWETECVSYLMLPTNRLKIQ